MTDLPLSPSALAEVEAALAEMTEPGRWMLWTSCSWRRIGLDDQSTPVIEPTRHPHDGHPDLSARREDLDGLIAIVNHAPALLHAARECERLREDIEYHARQHEAYRRKCRHYEEAVCVQGIGPVRLHQDGAVTKEIDHRKLGALFHDANAAITLRADLARLRSENEQAWEQSGSDRCRANDLENERDELLKEVNRLRALEGS